MILTDTLIKIISKGNYFPEVCAFTIVFTSTETSRVKPCYFINSDKNFFSKVLFMLLVMFNGDDDHYWINKSLVEHWTCGLMVLG